MSSDWICENIEYNRSWKGFFTREDIREELEKIYRELGKEKGEVYPISNKVFRAFNLPMGKISVVVLGMDPYHTPGSAVGLCFSVPKNSKIPPSLRNIYKELENEGYDGVKDGDLEYWRAQGCLMLNTALTVREGEPDSHTELWFMFTLKVIEELVEKTQNVAWLLMGAKALVLKDVIESKNGHVVFGTSHPSPFSANRCVKNYPAFIGSDVFRKINVFLQKHSRPVIKWIKKQ
jgi:uracil-DNA glycosylase